MMAGLLALSLPASANVYIHVVHFLITNQSAPCAEIRVQLNERGKHYAPQVYRLQGPPFGSKAERITLDRTALPAVTVTAQAGTSWHHQYGVCLGLSAPSAPVHWQTTVLHPPDSVDLAPFHIIFRADHKLVITKQY